MAADRRGHVAKLSAAKHAATSFVERMGWGKFLPGGLHDFQGMRRVIWAASHALSRRSQSCRHPLMTRRLRGSHARNRRSFSGVRNGDRLHHLERICCSPRCCTPADRSAKACGPPICTKLRRDFLRSTAVERHWLFCLTVWHVRGVIGCAPARRRTSPTGPL